MLKFETPFLDSVRSTQIPPQYRASEALERFLGAPSDPVNLFSFDRSVTLDEREEYPKNACDLLKEWKLHHYYVPSELGGRLTSHEELYSLLRVVARRDFTVAWAHGMNSILGTMVVWVFGDLEQRQKLARIIMDGGQVAVAYHEKEHGGDLLAAEVEANRVADGFLLSGQKWLIGNATRSAALTVLARTRAEAGARGFSLFLVEKEQLEGGSFTLLPKIKTHGIRGADISGIRFDQCLIPASSLIGPEGAALEITLKAFQLTRTLIPALSLGAADTALRTTLKFTLERRLYGGRVWDLPQVQRTVVESFVQLLICECVAISAARALHVATEQMSVWSAVAKYYVPVQVERLVKQLGVVLGARSYLREEHDWGIFQKIVRDCAVVSLGHAGTSVNLLAIAQNHALAARRGNDGSGDETASHVEAVFSLVRPLPEFDPGRLELANRGRDDVLHEMKKALVGLEGLKGTPDVDAGVLLRLITFSHEILEAIETQDEALSNLRDGFDNILRQSTEPFELAKRHCTLFAAAACIHMWMHNRRALGEFFLKGEWLALCLGMLMQDFDRCRIPLPQSYSANIAQELLRLYRGDSHFSIVPLQLARASRN